MKRIKLPARRPALPNLGSWTLARRLHAGFGLLLAFLFGIGALSWLQTGSLAARMEAVVGIQYRQAELASTMQNAVGAMMISITTMTLSDDPEDIKFETGRVTAARRQYDAAYKALAESTAGGAENAALAEQLKLIHESGSSGSTMVTELAQRIGAGATRESMSEFVATQLARPRDQWMESLSKLQEIANAAMHASAEQTRQTVKTVQAVTASAVALALLASLATAFTLTRSITRPLADAVALSRRVAQGDLSINLGVPRNDEFGALQSALGDMQSGLRAMVSDIRDCANNIHTASSEVAGGNTDLSQRTERAASNLQQTASSMEQLNGSVRGSASAAASADQLATTACQAAQRGGDVVQRVIGSMGGISSSSKRIGDIIGVIDGIAFQTNILALNAAVEAARAGEQGRGFAVVAGEVRNLAQRAASAAKEIKVLVSASVEEVESGTRLVQDAGTAMTEIGAAVERVSGVIRGIASSAVEQTSGIAIVSSSVTQLDQMTQQNSALVEQSAAAAESLEDQAEKLNALINGFRLEIEHA